MAPDIWSEPLTQSERDIIARVLVRADLAETTHWLNHVLKCYDALLAQVLPDDDV